MRGEDLKKLTNQKQELPVAAMFVNGSRQNVQSLKRIFHRCFLPSCGSFQSRRLKKYFSPLETAFPNELQFGRKHR
jgi:hypothetical protein